MPLEDETAIFTTVKGNFARDFLPSRRSQMVPNAVYRGSPINVGFREALLIAYASDMRRLPPICSLIIKQIGSLGGKRKVRLLTRLLAMRAVTARAVLA